MKVVCDTSCLTTLLKAGEDALLRSLFGAVIVPPGVWVELMAFHQELPPFVECQRLPETGPHVVGTDVLGRGEVEAITLALATGADLFLSDDRKALATARAAGLRASGLVGVLLLAKRRQLVPAVCPLLETLERRGGLYLSEEVREEARRLAGE